MKKLCKTALGKTALAIIISGYVMPTTSFAQSLEQAVAKALDTNPHIHQAFNRFKAREEIINQAKANLYPSINFDLGAGMEWTESPTTRINSENYGTKDYVELTRSEFGISFKQLLFNGFQTLNEIERNEYEASSEQWNLYATAENLALEVSKVYLEYLRAKNIVKLAQKNLESHDAIYVSVKEKTDSGFGSTADLAQVTGRLARANSNLISAKNNLSDLEIKYLRLVNQLPTDARIPVPDARMLTRSLDETLSLAKINHPILKAAERDISAVKSQHKASKGNYYPQVSFELSSNWDVNIDGNDGTSANPANTLDVGGANKDLLAMVRINYNLFSGGKDWAKQKEAAYRIQESKAVAQNASLDVVEGATLAWNARIFIAQQLKFLKQHVESAAKSRDAFQSQFSLGQRSLFDVLDSENELFQARKEYLIAEYDDLIAQYRLLNSTGRLLESLRVTTPEKWLGEDEFQGGAE